MKKITISVNKKKEHIYELIESGQIEELERCLNDDNFKWQKFGAHFLKFACDHNCVKALRVLIDANCPQYILVDGEKEYIDIKLWVDNFEAMKEVIPHLEPEAVLTMFPSMLCAFEVKPEMQACYELIKAKNINWNASKELKSALLESLLYSGHNSAIALDLVSSFKSLKWAPKKLLKPVLETLIRESEYSLVKAMIEKGVPTNMVLENTKYHKIAILDVAEKKLNSRPSVSRTEEQCERAKLLYQYLIDNGAKTYEQLMNEKAKS